MHIGSASSVTSHTLGQVYNSVHPDIAEVEIEYENPGSPILNESVIKWHRLTNQAQQKDLEQDMVRNLSSCLQKQKSSNAQDINALTVIIKKSGELPMGYGTAQNVTLSLQAGHTLSQRLCL